MIEIQFYCLLPLLMHALWRLSRGSLLAASALLVAAGVGLLAVRIVTVTTGHPTNVWRYSLPASAVFFIPGLLLALVRVHCDSRPPTWMTRGVLSQPLAWLLPSLGLLLVVLNDYRLDGLLLLGWFLLVGACVLPLGGARGLGWLSWRPLSLVGVCSYSLYLWHEPIVRHLSMASWAPNGFLPQLAIALPLTLLVAGLSYRLVEAPFLRLRRQWKPDRSGGPA